MGCCTRAGAALLAAMTAGCVTGHLFEAGRRWEEPRAFEAASRDGERLFVRYVATISDDAGAPVGEQPRRAVVHLGRLPASPVSAEDVRVEPVADAGPLPGRSLVVEPSAANPPVFLVVQDDGAPLASLPANAFTTTSTAPWVYPLVPLALCVDATTVPVLIFFAPGAMVIGD